ncbi:MAG: DUF5906 domain-containing protein, partial [Parabacteroides sp.]|nr:DUF5906 domain-containing protein [Parabacteroides sp.]
MHRPVHLRADELVKLPEEPNMRVVTTAAGVEMRQYNSWRRWGCSPVKGDVTPFLTLFDFLTESLNKKQRQWLLQWFAYPLQNPKKNKMASAVVMYGETQGTGKSLLGTTMQRIYGFSGEVIRASILSTQFNAWLDGKLFIACDEMASDSRSSFYTFSETMKTYVTDPKVLINQKNVKLYSVENRANFYFTTNKSNAIHLDRVDRRYFVCEVKGNPLPQEFYTEYGRWMESGGVEALFYYLRSEVSLSGFVHTAPPPQTDIKAEMTIATSSNEALWLRELIDDDSFMLRRNGIAFPCDLASVSELMEAYNNQPQILPTRIGRGSFGSVCREAGLRPVYDGKRLNTKRGKSIFYARANIDKWVKASSKDVISYIDSCIPKRSRAKRKF